MGPTGVALAAPIEVSGVVVADDDSRSRQQSCRALHGRGFEVVAEAADTASAVALALEHQPDLCLLEVSLPGGGGIRAAAELSIAQPGTVIVMYAARCSEEELFGALRAGAKGYLLKDTDPVRLPLALKGALRGEAALPRQLTARLVEHYRNADRYGDPGREAGLSPREWHVLELLRQGLTTAEIATRLYVTPVTVRSHLCSAKRKLGVTDRAAALELVGSDLPTRRASAG